MALKILATADLHLGKKSSNVPDSAEEGSTKYTWNRIVNWAIKNEIDALLLSGDIVDQDNRYFEAIGPLQSGFDKLKRADIAVYMVAGNHDFDVLPQIIGTNKYENVHLLGFNGEWEVKIFSKNGEKVQFVGWSFPKQFVTEDPLLKFNGIKLDSNYTTIGLLHGDVDNRESKYGPIESNNFMNKQVDIWILGHIHKPQEFRNADPYICYPGSPHALSSKEPGIHDLIMLTLEERDDIKVIHVPLSPVRYENITIDITNADNEAVLRDTVTSALFKEANDNIAELENVAFLVYDVYLEGHHTNIKDIETWTIPIVNDYDHEMETEVKLSVRKVIVNVQPKVDNMEELAKQPSPAGILANNILAIQKGGSTEFLDELLKGWNLKLENINTAGTYQPLRATVKLFDKPDMGVKKYILHECNRLLAELLAQQAK